AATLNAARVSFVKTSYRRHIGSAAWAIPREEAIDGYDLGQGRAPDAAPPRIARRLRRRTRNGDRGPALRRNRRLRPARRGREERAAAVFPRALPATRRAREAAGLDRRDEGEGRDPVRRPRRRRQRRRHQAHHATTQSAHLPRRRAAGAERPRADAVV